MAVVGTPRESRATVLETNPSTFSETVQEGIRSGVQESPLARLTTFAKLTLADMNAADAGEVFFKKEDAESLAKENNVYIHNMPDEISKAGLDALIDRQYRRTRTQAVLSRSPYGVTAFAAEMAGSMLDPINVAASFIPVPGFNPALNAAGRGLIGAAAARAKQGAASGAFGNLIVAGGMSAPLANQVGDDYGVTEVAMETLAGALMGSVLHAGAGMVGDAWRNAGVAKLTKQVDVDMGKIFNELDAFKQKAPQLAKVIDEQQARIQGLSLEQRKAFTEWARGEMDGAGQASQARTQALLQDNPDLAPLVESQRAAMESMAPEQRAAYGEILAARADTDARAQAAQIEDRLIEFKEKYPEMTKLVDEQQAYMDRMSPEQKTVYTEWAVSQMAEDMPVDMDFVGKLYHNDKLTKYTEAMQDAADAREAGSESVARIHELRAETLLKDLDEFRTPEGELRSFTPEELEADYMRAKSRQGERYADEGQLEAARTEYEEGRVYDNLEDLEQIVEEELFHVEQRAEQMGEDISNIREEGDRLVRETDEFAERTRQLADCITRAS